MSPPPLPLCRWTELPTDCCPHCSGELPVERVVCNHGQLALDCSGCASGAPRENRAIRPERHTLTGMRMGAFRVSETEYDVVLGPCPGCQSWQLDYTDRVAAEFFDTTSEQVYEFGSAEPVELVTHISAAGFADVIEDALAEHLDECPHLQRLIAEQ